MHGFGILGQVIPEHCAVIGVREMGGRVTLLGMDKVRELGRVAKEEDRGCCFATISQLPSAVLNLTEKPLGSRAQS